MKIFQSVYCTLLFNLEVYYCTHDNKISRLISRAYIKQLNKNRYIPVLTRINHQFAVCPFSHCLLKYQKLFPKYDKQLSKICNYVYKINNKTINVIDIGANIGDTVLNIGVREGFYILVEGNDVYSQFVSKNLKKYNYSLERCYISDALTSNYKVYYQDGTAHLEYSKSDSIEHIRTLDEIVEDYKDIKIDLIKIDTDGFDFKVIRSALNVIERDHPLIYFEWDKYFLFEQQEDPLSIFPLLNDKGYDVLIIFDNYGNFFDSVEIGDYQKLSGYIIKTREENYPYYYDVLVIHKNSVVNKDLLLKELL